MYNYIVDWEEFNLIRDYVRPNDQVADVGSNMGYYTIWMSKFITSGKIYAFEPDKTNYLKLVNNVKLNKLHNVVTS
jgi:FkbM family methyltransferase